MSSVTQPWKLPLTCCLGVFTFSSGRRFAVCRRRRDRCIGRRVSIRTLDLVQSYVDINNNINHDEQLYKTNFR
jgi:hypothetical protein